MSSLSSVAAALLASFFVVNFCGSSSGTAAVPAQPKVTTKYGEVAGTVKYSHKNREYWAFEGIPYAKPPVGDLRFEPPVAFEGKWNGTLQANDLSKKCWTFGLKSVDGSVAGGDGKPHPGPESKMGSGTEDCLYLHVYTPAGARDLPVVFHIHGGFFSYGSVNPDEAKYLIDRNVVYVSVNYRLGVLGFLSSRDHVVPGNMGLKDQSMALRWVRDNIRDFGGDPGRVTLTGVDAGGASVHLHMLSPMSRGLFQHGISASGTALNCWAQTEYTREKLIEIARHLECGRDGMEVADLVKCMKTLPAGKVVYAQGFYQMFPWFPVVPFGPVVETKWSKEPFLSKHPVDLIKEGKTRGVTWVTGVTTHDGLSNIKELLKSPIDLKDLRENWGKFAVQMFEFEGTVPYERQAPTAWQIWNHYAYGYEIIKYQFPQMLQMYRDRMFAYDALKAAKLQSKAGSEVYFYSYEHKSPSSFTPRWELQHYEHVMYTEILDKALGPDTGDDYHRVVAHPRIDPFATERDKYIHDRLLDMWSSLAHDGTPNIGARSDWNEWIKVDRGITELNYLYITSSDIGHRAWLHFGERLFWDSIDFDENRGIKSTRL